MVVLGHESQLLSIAHISDCVLSADDQISWTLRQDGSVTIKTNDASVNASLRTPDQGRRTV